MNFDQLKHAAHVWLAQPELINDSTLLSHYRAILSPQELQQCDRFYFEHDRHHYLVAHALLRTVLSFYTDASPQDYVFNKNDYGRPELAEGNWPKSLRFNISHTRGLVACIVTDTIDCGVDVEGIRELSDLLSVAKNTFAKQEYLHLQSLSDELLQQHFYVTWTLKEAYIKARGMGLSLPLKDFSFEILTNDEMRVHFDSSLQDREQDWQFLRSRPTDTHFLAAALCRKQQPDYPIIVRTIVPGENSIDTV